MLGPSERRRRFWPIALLLQGTILGAGGLSYTTVSYLTLGESRRDVEALYALGSVLLLFTGIATLACQRKHGTWPFELPEDPDAPAPLMNHLAALVAAAVAAGLGTGLYAGLLNNYCLGDVKIATAIAILVLTPLALLGVSLGERALRAHVSVVAVMIGCEVGGQVGLNLGHTGGYVSTLTLINTVILVLGLAFTKLVEAQRGP